MTRIAAVFALLLASLLVVTTAAANDPRAERVRLTSADVALAKRVTLRSSDLARGWRRVSLPPAGSGERLTCRGFNPDLSRFTITGKAMSGFVLSSGASAVSAVEVYRSRADAVGDFRAAANRAVVRCLRAQLEREVANAGRLMVTFPVARVVPAPRVGERRIGYRIVGRLDAGTRRILLYFDVVVVQRGRSIAALFFTSPSRRVAGQARVASAVAARMR